ncbi:hypothetical protein MicloDRAFT_00059540 [Microvirga lotononidis]|uniref:Uncharacterized protein n=1 Tax=Microvirga lotononidis TaxID=864069 RepID=I4YMP0_9HYPH|nr:hypothetical protein MicloDRAFT_00059540 [Microvirga lotononidis]
MIIDLPTSAYYPERSENLLHLAASMCFELVHQTESWGYEHDEETLEAYWQRTQPTLSNALTLVQQAQEMGLKGRIASVSPYLLISKEPRDWPRGSDKQDLPFSTFRTVDAGDLPKIHDTVCLPRLTEEQKALFEEIRSHRNIIVHHGSSQPLTAGDVLRYILRTFTWLHLGNNWFAKRDDYLSDDPLATLYSNDHVPSKLMFEFEALFSELSPQDFQSIFGANKRQRWYLCPHCQSNSGDADVSDIETAQLVPNLPTSTNIHCIVCDQDHFVSRQDCSDINCKGNVIAKSSYGDDFCLTCNGRQDS